MSSGKAFTPCAMRRTVLSRIGISRSSILRVISKASTELSTSNTSFLIETSPVCSVPIHQEVQARAVLIPFMCDSAHAWIRDMRLASSTSRMVTFSSPVACERIGCRARKAMSDRRSSRSRMAISTLATSWAMSSTWRSGSGWKAARKGPHSIRATSSRLNPAKNFIGTEATARVLSLFDRLRQSVAFSSAIVPSCG